MAYSFSLYQKYLKLIFQKQKIAVLYLHINLHHHLCSLRSLRGLSLMEGPWPRAEQEFAFGRNGLVKVVTSLDGERTLGSDEIRRTSWIWVGSGDQ